MKQPIKMTPGEELHLTALMAPFSLNLVTGQDRQHLLGYSRSAFEAGLKTAAAAEQAAWHAGLDEGRAQAVPAAVAVPDLQDMLRELRVQIHKITTQLQPTVDCSGVWMAHEKMAAALAATPAAEQSASLQAQDAGGMYYLQDARWSAMVGNCPSWWRRDGNGYTTNLDEAERFAFEDAMKQHRCRETDLPWLCSEVDKLCRPTVDCQYMPRSWADQRAAIAAQAAQQGGDKQ